MTKFVFLSLLILFSWSSIYSQETKVKIETCHGTMIAVLYDETPKHRDNFIKLVNEGFYEGLLFHRVINNFMIQGGDPDSKGAPAETPLGRGGPGYTIPAEIKPGMYHKLGALAAARTGDAQNPERRSSGSQFYIVHGQTYTDEQIQFMQQQLNTKFSEKQIEYYTGVGGTPHLDGQYTVFGQVIDGLDVIKKIAETQTNQNNRPLSDITILNVSIIE